MNTNIRLIINYLIINTHPAFTGKKNSLETFLLILLNSKNRSRQTVL